MAKARKIPTLNLVLHLCGSIIEPSLCQSLQKDKYDKAILCCHLYLCVVNFLEKKGGHTNNLHPKKIK
ncbi:hypothetical protein I79_024667 [Cricetulus griseus]|uniref:Ubiquitin-ribosomal protein eL40 fusion protein n=1 Tax=Cricetulus griseus TaxID=10029 RepID=G3ILA4_CRIGR|nr:hypothetical protein I79_024667 [Cricetulus griseus]